MMGTNPIQNLIRKGDDHPLDLVISTGKAVGLMTMEQSLAECIRTGRITRATAIAPCFRPDDIKRLLMDMVQTPVSCYISGH